MPSHAEPSDAQIIGQSLLPPGVQLPAYIKEIGEVLLRHIRSSGIDYPIGEDNLVFLTTRTLICLGWNAEHIKKSGSIELEALKLVREEFSAIVLDDGTVVSMDGEIGWPAIHEQTAQSLRRMQRGFYDREGYRHKVVDDPYVRPIKWEDDESRPDGLRIELIMNTAPDLIERVSAEMAGAYLASATMPAISKIHRSTRL